MSGSGKPGKTFKATVVSASGTSATIQGEAEDIAYLIPGTEYVFNVIAPGGRGKSGGDKPAPNPNA